MKYELLLRGGRVIDPANGLDGRFDVGIRGGKVVAVASHLVAGDADTVLDVTGRLVVPGLIDIHMHASTEFGGQAAHRMLALAGVTTALDMAGPISDVLNIARQYGAGLHIACLNRLKPGELITGADPTNEEVQAAVDFSLDQGAIGIKVLGGHFPLTPEAARRIIARANATGAWVAIHCGTTETGSNLHGLREALQLSEGNRLHVAHINSYCRGVVKDSAEEAMEAIALLQAAPHVISESYLAVINGTWANIVDGVADSGTCRNALVQGGYTITTDGLRQAILAGFARIHVTEGGQTTLQTGAAAVAFWEAAGTRTGVSFPVNGPIPRVMVAAAKDKQGRFVVDALATDGGGIPRNDMISSGLRLVDLEVFSLADFVHKACWAPAQILGLPHKGHLAEGADADITIIDQTAARAETTISAGQVVMHHGLVMGRGTRFLTTSRGAAAVAAAGLEPVVVDLAASAFYQGKEAIRWKR